MRQWVLAGLLWACGGVAQAIPDMEAFERDQRIGRYMFTAGATAPVLLAGAALIAEDNPTAATVMGGTAVVISGASLPLLGRRAMLAGDHLELTAGKGAVALFFGIGTALSGAYYVAVDPNNGAALTYTACTIGSLTLGGLQLRENTFVAEMRSDPRQGSLYLSPTPNGVLLTGTF